MTKIVTYAETLLRNISNLIVKETVSLGHRAIVLTEDIASSFRQGRRAMRLGAPLIIVCAVSFLVACGGGNGISSGGTSSSSSSSVSLVQSAYLWKPVAIGGGGFITGWDADPTGTTRVIRTDVGGAYVWVPAANSNAGAWVQLVTSTSMPSNVVAPEVFNTGAYEIAVAPSNPNRIYMAIANAVYRTDNAGKSFVALGSLPTPQGTPSPVQWDANGRFRHHGKFMLIDSGNPDIVLLGTPQNGLFRSTDAGATWTPVSSVPQAIPVDSTSDPADQGPGVLLWHEKGSNGLDTGNIWALSYGVGMFKSTDHGATFTPLPSSGTPAIHLKEGAFDGKGIFYGVDRETDDKVWKYSNGTWTDLTQNASNAGGCCWGGIAVNPTNGYVYLLNEGGQLYVSSNGGATFNNLPFTLASGQGEPTWLLANLSASESYFAVNQINFDPAIANRAWINTGIGEFYVDLPSNATSAVYTSQTRGVEELVSKDIISPPGQNPVFASLDFGIHVRPVNSLDVYPSTWGPIDRVLLAAQQLDWSAGTPSFLVTNASDTRYCCNADGNAVFAGTSTDGGNTWTKFETFPTPPEPAGTTLTGLDVAYAMSFGSIGVSANSTQNIVWLPTFNRAPFFTKDGGATWSQIHFPGESGPLTGSHFAPYLNEKIVAADRVLPGTFYYYHADNNQPQLAGLWVTTDGGATWTNRHPGALNDNSYYNAKLRAVFGQAGNLFFTTGALDGEDAPLYRSVDGGTTWSSVSTVTRVEDVAFGKAAPGASYPAIYIIGKVNGIYGIWRSIDNAISWEAVGKYPVGSLDEATAIEASKDTYGLVYVGFQGSGWKYGQPSTCAPAPYAFPASSECYSVP